MTRQEELDDEMRQYLLFDYSFTLRSPLQAKTDDFVIVKSEIEINDCIS